MEVQAIGVTQTKFKDWLSKQNSVIFTVVVALSSFLLYSCVYTFRKTFSVATFEGMAYLNISYKVWLVTFQVLGYALSKFIGIKVISELTASGRAKGILLMVCIAGLSWLAFAIVPPPFNIIFLFTNGLPLGLIWGMIFGYLEGRQSTEALGAGLSTSFIFASGFSRSTGAYIMQEWHITEFWMPFVTCCIFILPLILFLWVLDQVPAPSSLDEQMRTKRTPMNKEARINFIKSFLPGIVLFVVAYMLLTAYRDFRDNFSAEIWTSLHYTNSPQIFTITEVPVAIAVLIIMGSIMFIKSNRVALVVNHLIILSGMIVIGWSTYLFEEGSLQAPIWMVLIGLGLYMGYVPFNSIFFERLLAAFRYTGTVGFVMYVADAFGYLGSVGVMFFKEFGFANLSWLSFFIKAGYATSIVGSLLTFGSLVYFIEKRKRWRYYSGPAATRGAIDTSL
ncbi:MAG: DUF5690 family protein [Cyclobacteriaceae bacterium]